MKRITLNSFSLALFFLFVSLLPFQVSAQDSISIELSPTLIEERVDPGTSQTHVITAKNLSGTPMILYPLAQNITGVGADLLPIYETPDDNDTGYSLATWITYAEDTITILPGETKKLSFTINFPADARPGSHMAGIFLADKSEKEVKNGSGISFQVGSIVNFQIAGDIIEDTQIREFYTTKTVYGDAHVGFTAKIENLGNVLSRPYGLIDINNMFGKKVASLVVNDKRSGIFPKTTREFSADWNPEDIQFGRYEAVITLAVPGISGTQTIYRVIQFWILPLDLITPILGGFLIFAITIYVLLRLYVRRQLAGIRTVRTTVESSGLSRVAAIVIALLIAIILGLVILFFYFG